MPPWTHKDPVSREFIGKARQLRRSLARPHYAEDTTLLSILQPLRKRWLANPEHKLREQAYRGAARDWSVRMPRFGRIDLRTEIAKYSQNIAEIRLTAGELNSDEWLDDEYESSIAAEIVTVCINKKDFNVRYGCCASFSIHAWARWFQRLLKDKFADLLVDVSCVVAVSPEC